MKVSRNWLQTFFDADLPSAEDLAHALTFHAFEIESIEGDVLDVKVTPNRGHDCLCHRGIAKEISAILNLPLKEDPLRAPVPQSGGNVITTDIDFDRAPIAAVAYVRGVRIGPSPEWLRNAIESIGQRSINNIVDATNYVMFHIGCPTHAFDAASFKDGDKIQYRIRNSKKGEKLSLLGGASIELSGDEAVIANAAGDAVDIGGVKGGMLAELKNDTSEVVLSASKFAPVQTRKAAQRFNQRTEAAKRFENEFADDLSAYGIHAVAELVQKVAGGEIVDYAIVRTQETASRTVSVTLEKINRVLGTQLSVAEIENAWKKLGMIYHTNANTFAADIPFERIDLAIPEDLVEEVGRIVGYDKVPATPLSKFPKQSEINQNFYSAEKIREQLIADGYSEVFTSVFAENGERQVANKVGGDRSYLRTTLTDGLKDALERNVRLKDLLAVDTVKLFEIGTVWRGGKEEVMIGTAVEKRDVEERPLEIQKVSPLGYDKLKGSETKRYQPFSRFPFIKRDIAAILPPNVSQDEYLETLNGIIENVIDKSTAPIAHPPRPFDIYEMKDGRSSVAAGIIFQSPNTTLTDKEVNVEMKKVEEELKKKGYEIR